VNRGQEAAPIIVGSTMYVVAPFPNVMYALDLENPGRAKWKYEPHPDPSALGVACCDWVNRGAAYADGRVFYNTLDNHTVALDAETGRELWKVRLGDHNVGDVDDDGAAGREGEGARRGERRRIRRTRMAYRARRRHGRHRLARVQHRPRRRR